MFNFKRVKTEYVLDLYVLRTFTKYPEMQASCFLSLPVGKPSKKITFLAKPPPPQPLTDISAKM